MNLPDGFLLVCVLMAAGMVVGFLSLAIVTDSRATRHPLGRSGAFRDQLLTLAPTALFMAWLGVSFFLHDYLTMFVRLAVLIVFAVVVFGFSMLPPVKRAHQRLKSLRRYPSQ